MSYCTARGVCFKYPSQTEYIIKNIDFHIDPCDKIGLTGRNGCGKSSLIKLIKGDLVPDEGHINYKENISIGHLPQEQSTSTGEKAGDLLWESRHDLFELKKKIDKYSSKDPSDLSIFSEFEELGGYDYEVQIEKTASLFGFDSEYMMLDIADLSAGEKTKLALCAIILQDPDIILLDEPTNHLDMDMLKWLEGFLAEYKKPFIAVSHDRQFLDNCINKIWEIDYCGLNVFSGNYSFYRSEKEIRSNREMQEYRKHRTKITQLRQVVMERKKMSASMENFKLERSVRKNGGYCKRDDGSGKSVRPGGVMKSAMAVQSRMEKLIKKEEAKRPFIEKKRHLIIPNGDLQNKYVLTVEKLSVSYGDHIVIKDLSFTLNRRTKLAITGRNGCGKSTLFKVLSGKKGPDRGIIKWAPKTRIGYYAQEFENLDFCNTIISEVLQGDVVRESFARTILGSLNIKKDMVYKKIADLSIGERSKVSLAKIIFNGPNVLLLDEPTNHLEIQSREVFEKALKEFSGVLIFISHDRYFVNEIADRSICLQNGSEFIS